MGRSSRCSCLSPRATIPGLNLVGHFGESTGQEHIVGRRVGRGHVPVEVPPEDSIPSSA